MKECRFLLLTVLVILTTALFTGCAGQNAAPSQKEGNVTEETKQGNTEDEEKEKEGEESKGPESAKAPETAANTEPSEEQAPPEERELTKEELGKLEDLLSGDDNGFLMEEFDRPEEIDWNTVLYTGAGLALRPTADLLSYAKDLAPNGRIDDLVALTLSDVEQFVLDKTDTPYIDARKPLSYDWERFPGEEILFSFPEYIYSVPFTITKGVCIGDDWYITYQTEGAAADGPFDIPGYVLHVKQDGDRLYYLSNLRSDKVPPKPLLNITFCKTKKEAEQEAPGKLCDTKEKVNDEPSSWAWAILEAREDQVNVSLDRFYEDGTLADIMRMEGVFYPGENILSATLDKGEKYAVKVNLAWVPDMRLSATEADDTGVFFGTYFFGQENGIQRQDEDGLQLPTYLTGFCCEDEGKRADYQTEMGLYHFLADEGWVYLDPATNKPAAFFRFEDLSTFYLTTEEDAFEFSVFADRLNAKEQDPPDLLCFSSAVEALPEGVPDTCFPDPYRLGDYLIETKQSGGEQSLTLTQANNGEGILSYLIPGADEHTYQFTFVRYQGADGTTH